VPALLQPTAPPLASTPPPSLFELISFSFGLDFILFAFFVMIRGAYSAMTKKTTKTTLLKTTNAET
jgi:hypothetical protein